MNYKFDIEHNNVNIPDAVMFGETDVPSYDFHPSDELNNFGLVELMEGYMEYPNKTKEEVRLFLNSIGYKEIT